MKSLSVVVGLCLLTFPVVNAFRSSSRVSHSILRKSLDFPVALQKKMAIKSPTQIQMYAFNELVSQGFNAATFLPQPFWLLLILAPNAKLTKRIMGPWTTVLAFTLIHFFIVAVSISEPNGTAPMVEFAGVFDPAGNPLQAMLGMMQYPNFVSEEWSHVLTWDLFVGRLIWMDGIKRNIFTPHSVLFCNLIGPPGLLLHAVTCLVTGKGFPNLLETNSSSDHSREYSVSTITDDKSNTRADSLINTLFRALGEPYVGIDSPSMIASRCAIDCVWEDLRESESCVGPDAILTKLRKRVSDTPQGQRIVIDSVADGMIGAGYNWHLESDTAVGKNGLRGTTFIELNAQGQIAFVREGVEPLFKPGGQTAELLRKVTEKAAATLPPSTVQFTKRNPATATEMIHYLWLEVNGKDKEEALRLFDDDIVYEDLNFKVPFLGKESVRDFLDEFDIPGIEFIPERIGDGVKSCAFTWKIKLAGIDNEVRGISLYETRLNADGVRKISMIRDIPESTVKPPPLGALAELVNPNLKVFDAISV
jgi:hypothetical protein